MSNKVRRFAPIAMIAMLALTSCAGPTADDTTDSGASADGGLAEMEPISLKMAESNPEGSAQGIAIQAFADRVSEASKGKIDVEIYWAGSLAPYANSLSAASTGLADIAQFGGPNNPEDTPGLAWLPGVGTIQQDAWPLDYLAAHAATVSTALHSEEFQAEFTDNNVKVLWLGASPKAEMYCTSPVRSVEEAEGKRVRTYAPMWSTAVEKLGMVPVGIPLLDVYEALQRGVLDCATTPSGFSSMAQYGISEAAPYMMPLHLMGFVGNGYIMNLDRWNSLPAEAQAIIDAAAAHWAADAASSFVEQYSEVAQNPPSPVEFVDAQEINEALGAHNKTVYADLVSTAPSSLKDPQAIIDQFATAYQEWRARLLGEFQLSDETPLTPDEVRDAFISGPDTFDPVEFGGFLAELYARN
ncbi:TRAP transporter substrate-binding protein DctP [Microbacterium sp. A93]|uniref:TRAP transporter substrate-binding protein DctP n=1 Tax=Microbacterium sp. A93 TaxID=3450716 RepID=UPI003F42DEFD